FVLGETVGTAIPGEDFVAPVTWWTDRAVALKRARGRVRGIVRGVASELERARTERRPRRHFVEAHAAANLEVVFAAEHPRREVRERLVKHVRADARVEALAAFARDVAGVHVPLADRQRIA